MAGEDGVSIRDKTAIVGIGETAYYKHGGSPVSEFQLACEAILKAVDDAGLAITDIDGICSYSYDRNEAPRLATALGIPSINFASVPFAGGGGGASAAVGQAAAAVVAGYAKYVVAFRSRAQGQFGRAGQALGTRVPRVTGRGAYTAPFGMMSPAQSLAAMQGQRHMYEYGTKSEHFGAISIASYKHAQRNPRAVMYGRPLDMEKYLNSRLIVAPLHLFDCCLENDGAAAAIITTAERARDLKQRPAYILAAAQGLGNRYESGAQNRPEYLTTNHNNLAPRLWKDAGVGPEDVDVAQFYENFTPLVLMTIEDYGFCKKGEGGAFVEGGRIEHKDVADPDAPHAGELPINTSGGNLAEAYIHGFQAVPEAVRQIRGTSTSQVDDVDVSFVAAGPGVGFVSSLVLRK